MRPVVVRAYEMTDEQVVQHAQNVFSALNGNPNVPAPNPPLPVMQALIAEAEAVIDAYEADKAALKARKVARDAVVGRLVQALATQAITVQIATGGDEAKVLTTGFSLKARSTPLGVPAQVKARTPKGG